MIFLLIQLSEGLFLKLHQILTGQPDQIIHEQLDLFYLFNLCGNIGNTHISVIPDVTTCAVDT